MQDENMQDTMEEFILRRINFCGSHETDALQKACAELEYCVEKLRTSLSTKQTALIIECENAHGLVEGEVRQCYYRAGFSDAVLFLLGWRKGKWS